jgi:hypothetical protein
LAKLVLGTERNPVNLVTGKALVYVNHGRVIADCAVDCGFALKLDPGQTAFHCLECNHVNTVQWPPNLQEILDALAERPAPRNRNWFPEGHTVAVKMGAPQGQTPEDLREEARRHLNGED